MLAACITGPREFCVFFSVYDLEAREIHFDVDYPAGELDFQGSGFTQSGSLKAQGAAESLSNTLGEIRVHGHVQVLMEASCDRCLEPANCPVDRDFDLYYRSMSTGPGGDEVEIHKGEIEIGFYEKDGVSLEDVLHEYVLLAVPMQIVCKAECKGICPLCGQNRNEAACQCEAKPGDDRWAGLKNLKV